MRPGPRSWFLAYSEQGYGEMSECGGAGGPRYTRMRMHGYRQQAGRDRDVVSHIGPVGCTLGRVRFVKERGQYPRQVGIRHAINPICGSVASGQRIFLFAGGGWCAGGVAREEGFLVPMWERVVGRLV